MCFFSCNGQTRSDAKTITLYITNRSSVPIDSLFFPYRQITIKENIETGKTLIVKVDIDKRDINTDGAFPVFLYQKERTFRGRFGFHDWEVVAKNEEHIYLFNKGINYKDEKPKKPTEINLLLIPKTSSGIDSIEIDSSILKKKVVQTNYIELTLDFTLFEKNPEVKIYQNGNPYVLRIDHDWDNWNYNQEFIYVYDNGIFSKKEI